MSDAIFDSMNKFSELVHLMDERRIKKNQLISVQKKRCGMCYHWMKSSCVPEKQHKQFKSNASPACNEFILDDSGGFIPKYTQELAEIESRIAARNNVTEVPNDQ